MSQIQWYPGHMTKAKRTIQEAVEIVDLVIVVLDARIPSTSYNPEFRKILGKKPQLIVLNKEDMANPIQTKKWLAYYKSKGFGAVALNAQQKQGIKDLLKTASDMAEPVLAALEAKGRKRRPIRAMVVGSPNTGKSTLINALMPKATSKTGNKPGVTRGKQWVRVNDKIELLDTPGILWPKFENADIAFALAVTGAISNEVYSNLDVSLELVDKLRKFQPNPIDARYKIECGDKTALEIIEAIGRARGMLAQGGKVIAEEVATIFLAEFRNGKLGRFTLDEVSR